MKLYVCWDHRGGEWHHCAKAHHALTGAGHEPQVVRTYGWGKLPRALNPMRAPVRELTGEQIVAWAAAHPVAGAERRS